MRPIAKQDVKKTKLSFFDILLAINNRAKSQCILRDNTVLPEAVIPLTAVKRIATNPTKEH